jgi:hypothetical protein
MDHKFDFGRYLRIRNHAYYCYQNIVNYDK